MTRRALLLINRRARQGKEKLSQAVQQLRDLGLELTEESPEKPQNLAELIRDYQDRVDLVIIGGGDGTLNAAADALVEAQLPLGILPLGTANDLARTLNIPTSLSQACQVIAEGKEQRIDLGSVNGKHFFNVASLGLSVQITRELSREAKRRWGALAYLVTALRVVWRSRPFPAEIRVNGESFTVQTVQIAVGNGRYYGGGMTVKQDAAIDDQRLDAYSLNIRHGWQMIGILPDLWSGQYDQQAYVQAVQGQTIEIKTRRAFPINTDGEITAHTPATFHVVPNALSVLVP